ncbi:DDE_3 domain-containing protein [Trichonephila clavipes]|nr:DDE_3 domain-containing protein [Trichonephila clavipes]
MLFPVVFSEKLGYRTICPPDACDDRRPRTESDDIRLMDWSAKFPDLNPIKHIWGEQLQLVTPYENHPGNENSIVERVGPIAIRTDKLPNF